jgi:hypothetical protein
MAVKKRTAEQNPVISELLNKTASPNVMAPEPGCEDDAEFTTDFRLEACKLTTEGTNPFFIQWYYLIWEDIVLGFDGTSAKIK